MSSADNEHQSVIKTPRQLIATVVIALLGIVFCIFLLAQYAATSPIVGAGSQAQTPEAIAARLRPVADEGFSFQGAAKAPEASASASASAASSAAVGADAGKKLYDASCQACHAAGIAGAPKFGDKAAWAARIKQDSATLYAHAIKGFQGKAGMMPAKGGSSATDGEVKAAVDYMAAAAK